jgi:Family of unknown function (DUF5670)
MCWHCFYNLKSEVMIMRFGPFLGLALLLLVLWAGGFLMFHVAGALIHLLLLLAVISLVVHLFTSARTA